MLPAAVSHSTQVYLKLLSSGKDFPKKEALVQMAAIALQSCVYCKAFSCMELRRFAMASTSVYNKSLKALCQKMF